jgi:MFS family permease
MFLSTLAWQFVFVSLPFHIQAISPYDDASTLRWTGWILGVSSLVTVLTSPAWGAGAERGNPKTLYVAIEVLQGVAFVGTALARTLPELFVVRFLLGIVGGTSTFAFIIAGRSTTAAGVRRQVAAIQSSMTIGQVLGPLAGAVVAAYIGFRWSFVVGGAMLVGCGLLVRWGVDTPPPRADVQARGRGTTAREAVIAALVILGGSVQVFFLPAILPRVMLDLGVPRPDTLTTSGLIISASGVAAALGSLAAPRLAEVFPQRRLIPTLLATSAGLLMLFGLAGSVWSYGTLRFLQVLTIAPVFPMVLARFAQRATGPAIGFVNSARIAAAFVGPVVATSMLAHTAAPAVYVLLAMLALGCVPLVGLGFRRRPAMGAA